jgi:hypothetical protein
MYCFCVVVSGHYSGSLTKNGNENLEQDIDLALMTHVLPLPALAIHDPTFLWPTRTTLR